MNGTKIFSSYTRRDCFACTPLWRLLQMAFSPPSCSQEEYLLSCSSVRNSIYLELMQRSAAMTAASPWLAFRIWRRVEESWNSLFILLGITLRNTLKENCMLVEAKAWKRIYSYWGKWVGTWIFRGGKKKSQHSLKVLEKLKDNGKNGKRSILIRGGCSTVLYARQQTKET